MILHARAGGDARRLCLTLVVALALGCGGGEAPGAAPSAAPPAAGGASPAAAAADPEAAALMAMESFPGSVDAELAARGGELFQVKGCVACHTLGAGRLVGPDLQGVTERRRPGWIAAQILSPDSMIRNDPDAKALFAEYMTPMSDQGLTADEARAVLEFLRQQGGG